MRSPFLRIRSELQPELFPIGLLRQSRLSQSRLIIFAKRSVAMGPIHHERNNREPVRSDLNENPS